MHGGCGGATLWTCEGSRFRGRAARGKNDVSRDQLAILLEKNDTFRTPPEASKQDESNYDLRDYKRHSTNYYKKCGAAAKAAALITGMGTNNRTGEGEGESESEARCLVAGQQPNGCGRWQGGVSPLW